MSDDAKWYVIHTYSGYENKVKADIEKTIENRGMENLILDIKVPMEEVVEQKGDTKKVVSRKVYPGYVFIKMIMTDESWYVVRNTRGCTGFVGPGSKPVPLSEEEVLSMGVEKKTINVDFDVDDTIKIIDGPFEGFMGNITEMNVEKEQLTVLVSMFGRETPVTLFFNQVEALNG